VAGRGPDHDRADDVEEGDHGAKLCPCAGGGGGVSIPDDAGVTVGANLSEGSAAPSDRGTAARCQIHASGRPPRRQGGACVGSP
jgi:hypothetical protein